MDRVLLLNKTSFDRNRFYLFVSGSVLLTCVALYQLSRLSNGWIELHQKAPFIILLDLFPLLLILFLLFITRRKFKKESDENHQAAKDQLIKNISSIIEKIKSGEYDKERDLSGENIVDTALRDIYE